MGKDILIKGGALFALLAIIIGASIYGLNKKKPETKTVQAKTEIKKEAAEIVVPEAKNVKPLVKTIEKHKPEQINLYVESNEQIKKEFQRKRIQERRMYKMREMRARRLKERKFLEMQNKRKGDNA